MATAAKAAIDSRDHAINQAIRSGFKAVSRDHQVVGISQLSIFTLSRAHALRVPTRHYRAIADACETVVTQRAQNALQPSIEHVQAAREALERVEQRLVKAKQPVTFLPFGTVHLMSLQQRTFASQHATDGQVNELRKQGQ